MAPSPPPLVNGLTRFSAMADHPRGQHQLSPNTSIPLSSSQQPQLQPFHRAQTSGRPVSSMSISAMLVPEQPHRDPLPAHSPLPGPLQIPFAPKSASSMSAALGSKAQYNFGGLQYTPYRRNVTPDKAKGPKALEIHAQSSAVTQEPNSSSPSRHQFALPKTPMSGPLTSAAFSPTKNFAGLVSPSIQSSAVHRQPPIPAEMDVRELAERQQQYDRQSISELMRKSSGLQTKILSPQEAETRPGLHLGPPNYNHFPRALHEAEQGNVPGFRPSLPLGAEHPRSGLSQSSSHPVLARADEDDDPSRFGQMASSQGTQDRSSRGAVTEELQSRPGPVAQPVGDLRGNDGAGGNPRRQPNPHHLGQQQAVVDARSLVNSGPSSISTSPVLDRAQSYSLNRDRAQQLEVSSSNAKVINASPAPAGLPPRRAPNAAVQSALGGLQTASSGRNSPLPQAVLGAVGPGARMGHVSGPVEAIKSEFGKMFVGVGSGRNGGMSPSTSGRGSPAMKPRPGENDKLPKVSPSSSAKPLKKGMKRSKTEETNDFKESSARKKRARVVPPGKKESAKVKERKEFSGPKEGDLQNLLHSQNRQPVEPNELAQSTEPPQFDPHTEKLSRSNQPAFRPHVEESHGSEPSLIPQTSRLFVPAMRSNEALPGSLSKDGGRGQRGSTLSSLDTVPIPHHLTGPRSSRNFDGLTAAAAAAAASSPIGGFSRGAHSSKMGSGSAGPAMIQRRPTTTGQTPSLFQAPTPKLHVDSAVILRSIENRAASHLGTCLYSARIRSQQSKPLRPSHKKDRQHEQSSKRGSNVTPHLLEPTELDSGIEYSPDHLFKIDPDPLPDCRGKVNCTANVLIKPFFLSEEWLTNLRGRRALWGTDIYTDDSDIIAVLLHLGYILDSAQLEQLDDTKWLRDDIRGPKGSAETFPGERLLALGHDLVELQLPDQSSTKPQGRGTRPTLAAPSTIPPNWSLRVVIRVLPRLRYYSGSTRHGVQSRSWGTSLLPGNDGVAPQGTGKRARHDGMSFCVERVIAFRDGSDLDEKTVPSGKTVVLSQTGLPDPDAADPRNGSARAGLQRRRRLQGKIQAANSPISSLKNLLPTLGLEVTVAS